MMTLKQLEQRVDDLERQVAELRGESQSLRPLSNVQETFGMIADDPDLDGSPVPKPSQLRGRVNGSAVLNSF
jgi:hypothetical protein